MLTAFDMDLPAYRFPADHALATATMPKNMVPVEPLPPDSVPEASCAALVVAFREAPVTFIYNNVNCILVALSIYIVSYVYFMAFPYLIYTATSHFAPAPQAPAAAAALTPPAVAEPLAADLALDDVQSAPVHPASAAPGESASSGSKRRRL